MDASVLRHGVSSGSAVYTFNLARAFLEHGLVRRLLIYIGASMAEPGEAAIRELQDLGGEVRRGRAPWRWSPDAAWWLPVRPAPPADLDQFDVFHVGELYRPRQAPVPLVSHVHDLTHVLFPEYHTRLNRALHQTRLRWIERYCRRVITISENTRLDLVRLTSIPRERVDVVRLARGIADNAPLGAGDSSRILEAHGLNGRPFILSVGTLEPRKNHPRLVRAFERLASELPHVSLVLAGPLGWGADAVRSAVKRSPARQRIQLLGTVSSETLEALYHGATLFAYPSLYEGFGLPLLEAMAAGCPVLAAHTSSIPEVTGEAAFLVNPKSVEDIHRGLKLLLTDTELRQRLAWAGRERELLFTWRRTATATLEIYQRAVNARAAVESRF